MKRGRTEEIVGKKINSLTVLQKTRKCNKGSDYYYLCRCDCGNYKEIAGQSIKRQSTKSCGCFNRTKPSNHITHHQSKTKLYWIYKGMKARCYNSKNDKYRYYGGRGISLCKEWLGKDGALNFIDWATKNGYKDGLSIDRINVNGNYSPENCRWVTHQEQMFNRSNSVIIDGINLAEYVTQKGIISRKLAYQRYKTGWDLVDIVTVPPLKGGQKLETWKKTHPEYESDIARTRAELERIRVCISSE